MSRRSPLPPLPSPSRLSAASRVVGKTSGLCWGGRGRGQQGSEKVDGVWGAERGGGGGEEDGFSVSKGELKCFYWSEEIS